MSFLTSPTVCGVLLANALHPGLWDQSSPPELTQGDPHILLPVEIAHISQVFVSYHASGALRVPYGPLPHGRQMFLHSKVRRPDTGEEIIS